MGELSFINYVVLFMHIQSTTPEPTKVSLNLVREDQLKNT